YQTFFCSLPFRYQGQYFDADLELCYNRFRYYSPDSGTYISQDPIGLLSGEFNLYSYVKDSNLFLDPFGLECTKKINVGDAGHHVPAVRKAKGRP
ncbi:RHS repeat-associated core domain-containing protein, partial [Cellulophaga fucicola]|uniref:RHS repeat-associated core domain-containing protein n=1 Tax=Cellulophaga fucicola TaxID=76595 RepID=UPI003EB6CF0E